MPTSSADARRVARLTRFAELYASMPPGPVRKELAASVEVNVAELLATRTRRRAEATPVRLLIVRSVPVVLALVGATTSLWSVLDLQSSMAPPGSEAGDDPRPAYL